jgi:formylmethanofuran dehydrogenase subunit C
MPLLLQYRGQTSIPVEVEGLTPDAVCDKPLHEIERLPIFHGNQQVPLAEFFAVSGDASDARIHFEGVLAGVHWIGAHMTMGVVRVAGTAGRHVGSEMHGGEIHVEGDAGDWVGGEMHGGLIHVRGNAGHLVGAAYRGSRKGMTRGTILVQGSAGNEIGHTLRRGLIAIGGAAGDCPGLNMIAGSIYVLGECGIRPGAGMRRGTIGLFGPNPPRLLPTFRRGGLVQPGFLPVTWLELCQQGFAFPEWLFDARYRMYHGDLVTVGRGEILIPEST